MKKILIASVVVAASVAAGAWLGHRQAMAPSGESTEAEHKHALERKTDAEGKVYYTCGMHPEVRRDEPGSCPICGMTLVRKTEPPPAGGQRQVLYWYDPMHPDQHFDAPGKSPFMDMDLVPKYADEDGAASVITIDPRMVQNLGIRTAPVERGSLARELRAAGSVMADETRIEAVQARSAGWIEKLHVQSVNDPVRKGQLLAEIYAPELYTAQQEFVLARRSGDAGLAQAARQRLLLLGISTRQLEQLESTGEAQRRVAYYAPLNGVVTELGVREGAQLSPGMSLYTLVDLSGVWVVAEVPEALAAGLTRGTPVSAAVPALPGRSFSGRVDYVYPEVNPMTRTVRVRAAMQNPDLALKPGMFAEVVLARGQARDALLVPSEAVIRTGTRTTVIVAEGQGRFRPVMVSTGAERDGRTEILDGLEPGEQVVASGQFLIDSEANLRGMLKRLAGDTEPQP